VIVNPVQCGDPGPLGAVEPWLKKKRKLTNQLLGAKSGKYPGFVWPEAYNYFWQERECKITYLLTPWSRVFLEKLTVNFAAGQEIPRIYGTRMSLTVPTSARHLSLS
jgi:hypothetical protein